MRNLKSKNMRKFLIAAMAVAMFPVATSNPAAAQNGDWDDLQNSVTGGGTVNLGADYTAVSGNNTITVPSGGVTINGTNGASKYAISGYKNDVTGETAPQLINNTSTTGLTVNNVQMNQGGGALGGAIGNTGRLTVTNSTFTNNTTIPPAAGTPNSGNGGAIYNDQGSVSVSNTTFTGNGVYTNGAGEIIYLNDSGTPALPVDDGKPSVTINGGAIYNAAPDAAAGSSSSLTINSGTKFENNYAANGAAVYNAGTANITNASFTGNNAVIPVKGSSDGNYGRGGAIFNTGTDNTVTNLTVTNTEFTGNTAELNSGALYNSGTKAEITNSTFTNNKAQSIKNVYGSGGAVGNYRGGTLEIKQSEFTGNYAGSGGAIYNSSLEMSGTGDFSKATVNIENSDIKNNYATTNGGAVYTYGEANIKNSIMQNNGISADGTVKASSGGAIYNAGRLTNSDPPKPNGILTVDNVEFKNNYADQGAAITNRGEATVRNSTFENNGYSTHGGINTAGSGGAIFNVEPTGGTVGGTSTLTVENSTFKNNVANNGGAVYNGTEIVIKDSYFENNGQSADGTVTSISGGALYNSSSGTMTIQDSGFKGNTAGTGGALYAGANSTTNILAVNNNVVFGDSASAAANVDTVFLDNNATANMNASANRVIQFNSEVSGQTAAHANININPSAGSSGMVEFNAPVENTDITLNQGTLRFGNDRNLGTSNSLTLLGGTLNMLNGAVNPIGAGTLNINGNTNLVLDVDIANQKMDSILANNSTVNYASGNLNVSHMHSISDSSAKDAKILFTDVADISGNGVVTNSIGNGLVNGPIYKYAVKQMYDDGAKSGDTPGEYFIFNQIGNSDNSMIAPIAAQLGGFLLMDNLYRQSFANMDMVMLMSREQREAMKHRNKYASTDDVTAGLYQPTIIPEERDGFWVRPFSNFENVPLSGGPRVSNVSYGALVGGDSDIIDIGHGWDATYSFFGAYHGSHQAYNGIGIWQNGGTVGGVGVLYKGNFFTGLTANVSASGVSANSSYGNEDFPMLMTGAAWKSGYNFEFGNGRFILQPSYMMSYTFVNVFNYRDAAGLNIQSDPLNVIELIPGIKLIANTKNGWQPYLGVNMTWNLMDHTRFRANDVALDRLSVDPFVEYGVGLQRRVGDRLTGFGQAMVRNGGRNGVALTMGWRWALGD